MKLKLSDKTLAYAEKIASITLGIDALYRAELKGEGDGLVVVNMGQTVPAPLSGYAEARAQLAELARGAFALPEADRRLYYTQTCATLDAFCAWRQGQLPDMESQIDLFLHVDPAPASDLVLDGYLHELRQMLTELGYTGDLKQQCAAWEQKNLVPADEVQDTMNEMMAIAREKCGRILELPENDYYHCEVERGMPYNARSDYDHRCVVINIDPILTRPALKHLVCHEAYPGHFIQFSLRRMQYERGEGGADGLLSVCNHTSSSTFEGIADAGIEFIGWDEDENDRVCMLMSTIQAALGTAASYRMHTLKQSDAQVEDFLRRNAVAGGEGWVANRMGFIRDIARSALIWSYWRGDQGVFNVWRRVAPEDRARFFEYIYGRLHTVQSLQLFR